MHLKNFYFKEETGAEGPIQIWKILVRTCPQARNPPIAAMRLCDLPSAPKCHAKERVEARRPFEGEKQPVVEC